MTFPPSGSPTTRALFTEYCLRRLGKPVIEINVSDEQVSDRIDDAIKYWSDYHADATEKMYYKYQLVSNDFTNKYITLPDNLIGAVRIFDVGSGFGPSDLFNIHYQIALNDLYTLTSQSVLPFYMAISHLQFMQDILIGKQPIRFNRYTNRFHIDTDWTRWQVGEYLIIEAQQVIDPDVYEKAYGDRWLQRYATALIKRQWGQNLTKFIGMQMPGGVMFNAQKIYDDAVIEIEALEHEMINSWSLPVTDMIG